MDDCSRSRNKSRMLKYEEQPDPDLKILEPERSRSLKVTPATSDTDIYLLYCAQTSFTTAILLYLHARKFRQILSTAVKCTLSSICKSKS